MKQLIADLKAQLAAGTPASGWDKVSLYLLFGNRADADLAFTLRNNAEALLDYVEKLEAVVEAARGVYPIDTRSPQLIEALATLKQQEKV